MANWESLRPEAISFLDTHRDALKNFLFQLKASIMDARHHADIKGLIYSIYSRSDKQGGDELKADWKIAKKLHQWREKDASTRVSDIHDIVGLTVVVNFPSDRDAVADYLSKPNVLQNAVVFDRASIEEEGYYAIHLRVHGATLANNFLRAEIQIKTMLHDGWGAKTHDLTYKPSGMIDPALLRHMKILGDVLRQLDDQSELIKQAINERWQADAKRRAAARNSLFRGLTSGRDKDPEVVRIAEKIFEDPSRLAAATLNDPLLANIKDQIDGLVKRFGWASEVCQLMTLVASFRPTGDMNSAALDAVDRWSQTTKDVKSKFAAMNFATLTCYALGLLDKSVESARKTLELVKDDETGHMKTFAMANLAYFISEFALSIYEQDDALVAEAKRLSEQALQRAPGHAIVMDTRGAVLIALGTDAKTEVREGLRLCTEAFSNASADERPVAEAFFRLHEGRAFRRLLELESATA